jgi:hypothetical protein
MTAFPKDPVPPEMSRVLLVNMGRPGNAPGKAAEASGV